MFDIIKSNNVMSNIIKASVKTPPPNLTIEFAGVPIPTEQIYCSNYLLPHYYRSFTIDGIIDEINVDMDSYSGNNTTDTSPAGPGPHTHAIPSIQGSGNFSGNGTYKANKDIWLEDTLKPGDEVLVVVMGVYYVVVTKITKMPNGAIEGV